MQGLHSDLPSAFGSDLYVCINTFFQCLLKSPDIYLSHKATVFHHVLVYSRCRIDATALLSLKIHQKINII